MALITCPHCQMDSDVTTPEMLKPQTTQGLGRVIYGIELEDLYIMAALSGYEPSTALNSDFIAERCIEVGLLAYKRRLELKRVST